MASLRSMAKNRRAFAEQEAEVLAVFASPVEEVTRLQVEEEMPFSLFADQDQVVRRSYRSLFATAVRDGVMVLVLDRYGGPYAGLVVDEPDDPSLQSEILDWLAFIEIQCPECGVPEWPPVPA
jgi:hypothetical protein